MDERKSIARDIFLLNNGAISWSSKKQTCIALLTMDAEFKASSVVVQEAMQLRRFMNHLGIIKNVEDSILVNYDSQVAIAFTKDFKYHCETKHIDTKYNYIIDTVARKEVDIQYISMHKMVANPFTKSISRDVFIGQVKSLGLLDHDVIF